MTSRARKKRGFEHSLLFPLDRAERASRKALLFSLCRFDSRLRSLSLSFTAPPSRSSLSSLLPRQRARQNKSSSKVGRASVFFQRAKSTLVNVESSIPCLRCSATSPRPGTGAASLARAGMRASSRSTGYGSSTQVGWLGGRFSWKRRATTTGVKEKNFATLAMFFTGPLWATRRAASVCLGLLFCEVPRKRNGVSFFARLHKGQQREAARGATGQMSD